MEGVVDSSPPDDQAPPTDAGTRTALATSRNSSGPVVTTRPLPLDIITTPPSCAARIFARIDVIHGQIDAQGRPTSRTQCTVADSGRVPAGDQVAKPTIKIITVMIGGLGPVRSSGRCSTAWCERQGRLDHPAGRRSR